MHSGAKGTADHYWPWAVFFKIQKDGPEPVMVSDTKILKFRQGSGPEGDDVL